MNDTSEKVKRSIFSDFLKDELIQNNIDLTPRVYKKGKIVYREGDKMQGFCYVNKGIIKVYKTGVDGKEQIIKFARGGDIMGFRSTITLEPACTTAKVIEEAEIFLAPTQIVLDLVKTNGNFALALLRVACKELNDANDHITDIAQKTVRERLAEALLDLKATFDLDHDSFISVSLTREELANIVGTSTESVIRLLSGLKQEGLIELLGRRIKILNLKKLERIALMGE